MRAVPSCRDGQYLDTRNSKLTEDQIVKHIDIMQAIRGLHGQIVQMGQVECAEKSMTLNA
jgi:hypothetical protein